MPIFPLDKHVVGSFGQIIRAGPFLDTAGAVRDMTGFAVTCELYAPNRQVGPSGAQAQIPDAGGSGLGTVDGFIEYRIQSTDFSASGIWKARLYAEDADERLTSELQTFIVVDEEEGGD